MRNQPRSCSSRNQPRWFCRGLAVVFAAVVCGCTDPDGGGGALHVGDSISGELRADNRAMPAMTWAAMDSGPADDASVDPDAEVPELDAAYGGDFNADTYTLDLAAGDSVQVVMCTAGDNNVLDPYLIVDRDGQRVLVDDDSAGDVNARVQIDAVTSGRYTIFATVVTQGAAYDGNRSYLLRVAATDPDGGAPIGCE